MHSIYYIQFILHSIHTINSINMMPSAGGSEWQLSGEAAREQILRVTTPGDVYT